MSERYSLSLSVFVCVCGCDLLTSLEGGGFIGITRGGGLKIYWPHFRGGSGH